MKINVEDDNQKFKPIKFEIIVENEEELKILWASFNNKDSELIDNGNLVKLGRDFDRGVRRALFEMVDKVICKMGLRP